MYNQFRLFMTFLVQISMNVTATRVKMVPRATISRTDTRARAHQAGREPTVTKVLHETFKRPIHRMW